MDRALAGAIDHTVLSAAAGERDILQACDDALRWGFSSVVVSPFYLPVTIERLAGSSVNACTVVSFPLGAHMPMEKAEEARRYVAAGAQEIDAVMNIGAYLSGERHVVEEELKGLVRACQDRAALKFIIETAYLDSRQIEELTTMVIERGVDFVKTSTGFASRGVTLEDVQTIKRVAGDRIGIKASGGIKTADFARSLLAAGATRLGCSSSLQIVGG